MLSAAMAALLAGAADAGARADTDITTDTNSRPHHHHRRQHHHRTGRPGRRSRPRRPRSPSIPTIRSSITAASANIDTSTATGILIDTSGRQSGDAEPASTMSAAINLTGNGTSKAALVIAGGNTFFGPITVHRGHAHLARSAAPPPPRGAKLVDHRAGRPSYRLLSRRRAPPSTAISRLGGTHRP